MSDKEKYRYVVKYKIELRCITPMHIGSGGGVNGAILIHPVTGLPFIQGTSLAGIFSEYVGKKKGDSIQRYLFGDSVNEEINQRKSKVIFSDAKFREETVSLEERTRVKINGETGSADGAVLIGQEIVSGQLLETEYVSPGAELFFEIHMLLSVIEESDSIIEECLKGLERGKILIGGQLSNGCGQAAIKKVEKAIYDLKNKNDRMEWRKDEQERLSDITESVIHRSEEEVTGMYEVLTDIILDRSVMVKGTYIKPKLAIKGRETSEHRLPDAMSITNGNDDYILPGSSIKGTLRSRMEMIADYLQLDKSIMQEFFEGSPGIYFEDAVIDNSMARDVVRIHINKFTGGVINGAKLDELVVNGRCRIRIRIKKEEKLKEAQVMCALLLFALRDLSIGAVNFGSSASIGRGFSNVLSIVIKEDEKIIAKLDPKEAKIQDDSGFVCDCIKALRSLEGKKNENTAS